MVALIRLDRAGLPVPGSLARVALAIVATSKY